MVDQEFRNSEDCYVECLQFLQKYYINPCIQYLIKESSDEHMSGGLISTDSDNVMCSSCCCDNNGHQSNNNKEPPLVLLGDNSLRHQEMINMRIVNTSSIQTAKNFLNTVQQLCSCQEAIQTQIDNGHHFSVAISNVKDLLLQEYCRYLQVTPLKFVKLYRTVAHYLRADVPSEGIQHNHREVDCSLSSLIAMPIRRINNYRDLSCARLKELDREIAETLELESMQKEASLLVEPNDERSKSLTNSYDALTSSEVDMSPTMLRLYKFRFQLLTCTADTETICSVLEGMVSKQHMLELTAKYNIDSGLLSGVFIREEELLQKVPIDGLFKRGKYELKPCVLIVMSECIVMVLYNDCRRSVQREIRHIPLSAVLETKRNNAVVQSLIGVDSKYLTPPPECSITISYCESEREKTLFFYGDSELDIVNLVTDIGCAVGKL